MIKAAEMIKTKIEQSGRDLRFISEYTGIKLTDLNKSLKGAREFKTDEILSLCVFLGLKLSDFCME